MARVTKMMICRDLCVCVEGCACVDKEEGTAR